MANSISKSELITEIRRCPICHTNGDGNLGDHIRKLHGDESYKSAVIAAKEAGLADPEIGELFNINFKQLERIITEAYGINITSLKKPKKVKHWEPKEFKTETTTVWSYRRRGDWATHDSRYRANWSPYIPRNIILRYSKPGDTVLDYFIGGGTTAIEAKLLGRKCIARDINPAAVRLTKRNLRFVPPASLFTDYPMYEPEVSVGNAKYLRRIEKESVDLICAHPPYAGIVKFGSRIRGDLSGLGYNNFIAEMRRVAAKSYSVLRPGGKCVILIGDARHKKHVVPIGFRTMDVFLDNEFKLKELIIKRQHNCKTTGFWYSSSIKNNFLLLAHEYLAVFEKPGAADLVENEETKQGYTMVTSTEKSIAKEKLTTLETTSVWILPEDDYQNYLKKNVLERYCNSDKYLEVAFTNKMQNHLPLQPDLSDKLGLLFIKSPVLDNNPTITQLTSYSDQVGDIVRQSIPYIDRDGFLVIQTRDVRVNGYIEPLGKKLVDSLNRDDLWLKEIIIVTKNGIYDSREDREYSNADLEITHQYLLVYEVKASKD